MGRFFERPQEEMTNVYDENQTNGLGVGDFCLGGPGLLDACHRCR